MFKEGKAGFLKPTCRLRTFNAAQRHINFNSISYVDPALPVPHGECICFPLENIRSITSHDLYWECYSAFTDHQTSLVDFHLWNIPYITVIKSHFIMWRFFESIMSGKGKLNLIMKDVLVTINFKSKEINTVAKAHIATPIQVFR